MKRIFISLPMLGRSKLGIEQERGYIEDWCRKEWMDEELLFIPPMSYAQSRLNPPVYNLGWSLQQLGLADLVVFSPDWNKARGCKVEHLVCQEYGIWYVELGHTEDPTSPYKIVHEKEVG